MGLFSFLSTLFHRKTKTMQIISDGQIINTFEKDITWEIYSNKIVCNMILNQKIDFEIEKVFTYDDKGLYKRVYGKHQIYKITDPQNISRGYSEIIVGTKCITIRCKDEIWVYT